MKFTSVVVLCLAVSTTVQARNILVAVDNKVIPVINHDKSGANDITANAIGKRKAACICK